MSLRRSLVALATAALGVGTLVLGGTPAVSAAASACSAALQHPGQLSVATDSPAYPPYFENNKPANGQGFESAVAYAIAAQLGVRPNHVRWTVEPFNNSYTPGAKAFDFDINEISITAARAKAVDFSEPYYTNPQAVVVVKGSKFQHATTLAALRQATIGVQEGTTSLTAVNSKINPSSRVQVFSNSNDVVNALRAGVVQAIVVDLATGFYLTSAGQVPHGVIVGQFNAPGGDNWGVLLTKHSRLTSCVSGALTKLRSNGTLAKITARWMQSGAGVPVLK
jgi:polar amino acid transport system substrate-binding protein